MSTTLMPSSGPMVTLAPDADGAFARAAFLVTAGRPEDQGRQAYGRMRECQHRRRPGERRDPYAVPYRLGTLSKAFPSNERRWLWVPAFAGTTMGKQNVRYLHRHCERSEAIHLSFCCAMDCFAEP